MFSAVDPPELKCIAVEQNNDITLTWVAPNDPGGEFVSYQILSSTSGVGPYSIAASIANINTVSYTYTGANLTSGTVYFYIVTKFNDGGGEQNSLGSDTLQPIKLNVNGLNASPTPYEYQAELNWNKIHDPKISTHSDYYRVYRKYIGETWQLIYSTQFGIENYLDSNYVCYDSAYYKIEVEDNSGCVSVSTIGVDIVGDETPPSTPVIDSVSIDPFTGDVHIGWEVGNPGDVDGYIVILELPTGGYQIDTVLGINNTYFLDGDADPNGQSENYALLAFDTCWVNGNPNTSAAGVNHQTIFLQGEVSGCDKEVQINWNKYLGWSSGVVSYKIYASENNGPFGLVSTVGGNATSFTHVGLNANSNYCYYVRAVEAGGTGRSSTSNMICLNIVVPNLPQNQYLNYVTVKSENIVEASCYIDLNAEVQYYNFERSIDPVSDFEILKQVQPETNPFLVFIDSTAKTSSQIYYYRVTAVDVCGNTVEYSNVSNTVLLTMVRGTDEYVNEIEWNEYQDWDTFGGGVSFYNVYRSNTEEFGSEPIAIIPPGQDYFIDDISDDANAGGTFCYLIRAIESDGNIFSLRDTSSSNIICTKVSSKVYVPNAFSPNANDLNDVFKPQMSFVDPDDFYMAIYDRFGHMIFRTADINEGWDGSGAPVGVYVYLIQYSEPAPTEDQKTIKTIKSTVTLIR